MPRLISGWPISAVSAAKRNVHASASSQPPPRQKPLITAMTGLPAAAMRSKTAWPRCASVAAGDGGGARQLVDVGAGDERLVAGAGQQDRPGRRRSASSAATAVVDRAERGVVQRVADRRPVERDGRDRPVARDEHGRLDVGGIGHHRRARIIAHARRATAATAAPAASAARSSAGHFAAGHERLVELVRHAVERRQRDRGDRDASTVVRAGDRSVERPTRAAPPSTP